MIKLLSDAVLLTAAGAVVSAVDSVLSFLPQPVISPVNAANASTPAIHLFFMLLISFPSAHASSFARLSQVDATSSASYKVSRSPVLTIAWIGLSFSSVLI